MYKIDHKKNVFLIQVESRLEAYNRWKCEKGRWKSGIEYLWVIKPLLSIVSQIKENKKYTDVERTLLNEVGKYHSQWDINIHDYIKEVCVAYTIWAATNDK